MNIKKNIGKGEIKKRKNVTAVTLRGGKKNSKINTEWKNMPGICLSQEANGAQGERLCFTVT